MNPEIQKSISQQIYHQFPEVAGCKPTIRKQPNPKHPDTHLTYLLTYRNSVTTADGKILPCLVRVVASEKGKIIKISSSR